MAINILAVVVSGLIHMFYGLIWYSSILFGKSWAELTGKELKPAPVWVIPAIIGHQAVALGVAIILNLANVVTLIGGAIAGLLIGLAFFVTVQIGESTWERIPLKLFIIRCGYHLTVLAIIGAILAVWK